MDTLLKVLEDNATLTPAQLAVMLDKEEGDIKKMIEDFEARGVILGYTTIIDWDKTDTEYVNALIELKVTPRVGSGYDEIAERIYNYPEVESVYLMSGGYDLTVMLRGKTMREVAIFVAAKLATIEAVTSTATHFVLRKYKDHNVIFGGAPVDERGNIL